jgi:hypothetical protein
MATGTRIEPHPVLAGQLPTLSGAGVRINLGKAPPEVETAQPHLDMMHRILRAIGFGGDYRMEVLRQIRWRSTRVLEVTRVDTSERTIWMKLRPGDSSTVWQCVLKPPTSLAVDDLSRRLDSISDWNGQSDLDKLVATTAVKGAPVGPPQPVDPIKTKVDNLRAAAARYQTHMKRVDELRAKAEQALKDAQEFEEEAKELEVELADDHAGRGAAEALQAIGSLLGVS